ncbi:MAG: NVEALA domain-containing protein [Tannerella sp.]|jgi:hypothetical protein|nr:NVEALA domain-containing protein [Tannerella sp.]
MKRIFFYMMIVAAIVVAAAWNVSQSKSEMALTDVALENVEALADEESSDKYKYVLPGTPGSGVACLCSGSGSLSCCG